jgi:LysM repeat protein
LYMDPNATVRAAYAAGRGNYLEELQQIFTRKPREIRPVIVYNPSLARARLEQIAAEVKVDPQEASLVYENGNFSTLPGVPGQALDIEAALAQFSADPQLMLMQGQIGLNILPVQPQQVDFSTLVEHHKSLVNKPLYFQAYDPISDETFSLTMPPEALVHWLRVEDPLSADPKVSLDGSQLPAYLDQWRQDQMGTGRVLESIQGLDHLTEYWQQGKTLFAMVRRLPTSYVVQRSDTIYSISAKVGIPYWRIEKANPNVDVWALPVGQTIVIPSKNDMLPLPVVLGKRIVISISQQHMWIYENGQELNDYVISSGMASSPTMPGVFQVTEHEINAYGARWDLWMPNWLSIYEAAPGFFNGIHGLPLLHNGVRLWANALGRPASYGCIILGLQEAEDVYNWAENGVVVEIKR